MQKETARDTVSLKEVTEFLPNIPPGPVVARPLKELAIKIEALSHTPD